jgi:preprotein translocase subunit SecF
VTNTSTRIAEDAVLAADPKAEAPRVSVVGGNGIRVETGKLDNQQTDQVKEALAKAYGVPDTNVTSTFVGPSWGQDVTGKAITSLVVFLVLVSLVITLYFRTWTMAVAAIVALIHDLLLTAGIYALVGFEVTPDSVIGFLTILGYSLYDTVVVFDKVRENTEHIQATTKRTYAEAANLAVNQTLVRSINTSVVACCRSGRSSSSVRSCSAPGRSRTSRWRCSSASRPEPYSSIFIATPLLVDLRYAGAGDEGAGAASAEAAPRGEGAR